MLTLEQAAWIAKVIGYHRGWSQEKIEVYMDVLLGRMSPDAALQWLQDDK